MPTSAGRSIEVLPVTPEDPVTALRCPATGQPLEVVSADEARRACGGDLGPRRDGRDTRGRRVPPIGLTPTVLLREDARAAYPVVDEIPVLLAPEVLTPVGSEPVFDLARPPYAEAYAEMETYDRVARAESRTIRFTGAFRAVAPVLDIARRPRQFPYPRPDWVDAPHDGAAQWDAMRALGGMPGRQVLQVGGKGIHAVKFLLAGARHAWVLTPVLGEALCARALAVEAGVSDRLDVVLGLAEEPPFAPRTFDAAYAGGCLHHTETDASLAALARVLRPGGCFAAVEPWRAPGYAAGIRVLGKREADVYCRPLDRRRLATLDGAFARSQVVHHGALTRYAMLALAKTGVRLPAGVVDRITDVDDRLCDVLRVRHFGSSVAVLAWV